MMIVCLLFKGLQRTLGCCNPGPIAFPGRVVFSSPFRGSSSEACTISGGMKSRTTAQFLRRKRSDYRTRCSADKSRPSFPPGERRFERLVSRRVRLDALSHREFRGVLYYFIAVAQGC